MPINMLFGSKKNKKDLNYVVKVVRNPRLSSHKIKRNLVVGGVILLNLAFLGGFIGFFARSTSNLSDLTSNLSTLSEQRNNIDIPTLTRSGLGLVSDNQDLFPQINIRKTDLATEFETIRDVPEPVFFPRLLARGWSFIDAADYDKNGNKDIYLQNSETNRIAVWLMNQSKVTAIESLPTIDDKNWKLAGVDDFNADGNLDFLWRYESGEDSKTLIWLMQNDQIVEQQWIEADVENLSHWDILGTGDFDGNDVPDIVFKYKGEDVQFTGALLVNFLEGKSRIQTKESKTTEWLPWDNNLDTEGKTTKDAIAVVDYDNDGFKDIVFRKNDRNSVKSEVGNLEIWLLKDIERVSVADIASTLKLNWSPIFFDVNQDFATDIVWQNIDLSDQLCQGRTNLWIMNRVKRLKTSIAQEFAGC
jgi:hypothetical protein